MFGLSESDLNQIVRSIQQFPEIQEAFIYGSRAMGNHKNGSDVDLAIKGEHINFRVLSRLNAALNEETSLPYHFDVTDLTHLDNLALKEHIANFGKNIFQRSVS